MNFLRKYKSLAIIAAALILYYITIFWLRLPALYLVIIYGVIIIGACVIFRAGLIAGIANLFHSAGKKDIARKLYLMSFKYKTRNPITYLNYAVLVLHEGGADQALEYARHGLTLNPDLMTEKNLRLTKGSAYWLLGELDSAVETLEDMVKDFDYVNVHVLTSLGFLYFARGDLEKAKSITEKAIEDTPDSGPAWDNMGQIYLKEDDLDKAEEAFKKALEIRSNLVDSLYFMGVIREKRGDKEGAREYYIRAKDAKISSLNTVSKDEVLTKYNEYKDYVEEPTEESEWEDLDEADL
ncbi:MAG: tetratricopeptide repeat protein [Clostridiales bacterium]|jgi:tetratricopeptide (TPR) repeat protein|nr:tetratricopeptide repeat protein [Clostridiales bacterium]